MDTQAKLVSWTQIQVSLLTASTHLTNIDTNTLNSLTWQMYSYCSNSSTSLWRLSYKIVVGEDHRCPSLTFAINVYVSTSFKPLLPWGNLRNIFSLPPFSKVSEKRGLLYKIARGGSCICDFAKRIWLGGSTTYGLSILLTLSVHSGYGVSLATGSWARAPLWQRSLHPTKTQSTGSTQETDSRAVHRRVKTRSGIFEFEIDTTQKIKIALIDTTPAQETQALNITLVRWYSFIK